MSAATERGINVVNFSGNTIATASTPCDAGFGAQGLPGQPVIRNEEWNRSAFQGMELYGRRWAHRFGRIGKKWPKGQTFQMRVLTRDLSSPTKPNWGVTAVNALKFSAQQT